MQEKIIITDEQIRDFLTKVYADPAKRDNFLKDVILTFGLDYHRLALILGEDSQKFKGQMLVANPDYTGVLMRAFEAHIRRQDLAFSEFYAYMQRFYLAVAKKNKEEMRACLLTLKDLDVARFRKNHQAQQKINDAEIYAIVKYQIKYLLSNGEVCAAVGIAQSIYANRVRQLAAKYPELINDFDTLADYKIRSGQRNV